MFENIRRFPFGIQVAMVFSFSMIIPAYQAEMLDLVRMKQAFLRSFVLIFVLSYLVGTLLIDRKTRGNLREHMLSVVLIYLLLPFALALPIWQSVPWLNFWQGTYEMFSSLTTTGATMVTSMSRYQQPIMIYTTIVAWMGGLLILIIAFAIFEPSNLGGFELLNDNKERKREFGGGLGKSDRFIHFLKIIAPPYIMITLLCYIVLAANGERTLYAFIQAMSAVSTSGLDPYFGQRPTHNIFVVESAIFAILLLGATRHFWKNASAMVVPQGIARDPEVRTLFVILTIFTSVAVFNYTFFHVVDARIQDGFKNGLSAIWGDVFTGLSFLMTHGIKSAYWLIDAQDGQTYMPKIVLLGLVMLGGGIGTTAAGIKLLRTYAMYKLSSREVSRTIDPNAIAPSGRAGRQLRRSGAIAAIVYLALFIFAMIVAVLVLTFAGMGFEEAVLTAIMSASNCGPVLDLYSDFAISIRNMHPIFYIVSGLTMVVGRIEVLILAILLNVGFWRDL